MPSGTPYITQGLLTSAPTGVSWKIIPAPGSTTAEQTAEINNVCWRATSIVDTYCNQVIRATVDNETLTGPGASRVAVQQGTCNGLLVMRRWPVTQVLAIQTSLNRDFPRAWSTVPAGQYDIEHPLINQYTDTASATSPDGGASILVAPGYVTWAYGRNGQRILVSYVNGWPHTSLTQAAAAGDTVLRVDDVTGWTGAQGFAYDGAGTEPVSVLSVAATTPLQLPNGVGTAQSGPGTVTLSAPLAYPHAAGVVVSSLPANVIWAAALAAASQALSAGFTSISVQNISGSLTEGGKGVEDMVTEYEVLLEPYRRIV
ncbi:MAG: hypothetical protein HOW97_09595 [Catenulispora sp.]|nr:hypothetical protein [Catenulispora sp.]